VAHSGNRRGGTPEGWPTISGVSQRHQAAGVLHRQWLKESARAAEALRKNADQRQRSQGGR